MTSLFAPIASFCRSAALKLAMLDGKPGLSLEDFTQLINRIVQAESIIRDGDAKHEVVAESLREQMPPTVADWRINVITYLAYQFAKRMGYLP